MFSSFQISISSNINVSRSRNLYSLEIRNATVMDSGKYTIKAKNFHGQCSATASLTVLRKYIIAIFLFCFRILCSGLWGR